MINLAIAFFGIGICLIFGEILWRKRILKGEYARKFVHITSASFVAFWPLFLSNIEIALVSLLFIFALILTKKLKLFRSLRSVRRATYGEIWYALGIGVSALVFSDASVFAVAVLTMALADGFAAVVGVALGKKAGQFKIYGQRKSFFGSLTFMAISFFINAVYWYFNLGALPADLQNWIFVSALSFGVASILTLAELLSPKGSDNIIVPVLAGLLVLLPAAF